MLAHVHPWLSDLVEAQFENLEFLWSQWAEGRRSANWTFSDLARHEARISAHVDALVLALREDAADDVLSTALQAGDPTTDLVAAQVLATHGQPCDALDKLWSRIDDGELVVGSGLLEGLSLASPGPWLDRLAQRCNPGDLASTLVVAYLGARHGRLIGSTRDISAGRSHDDAGIRRLALETGAMWLSAGLADASVASPSQWELARILDESPAEQRRELYEAACVARVEGLADFARARVDSDPAALECFAWVAEPDELATMTEYLAREDLGLARFGAAAMFGHPSLVDPLIAHMQSDVLEIAVAAGEALERMLGAGVWSDERVDLAASEDPDDEAEQVFAPDIQRARMVWEQCRSRGLAGVERLAAGVDATALTPEQCTSQLSLGDLRLAGLRVQYRGQAELAWHRWSALGVAATDFTRAQTISETDKGR